MPTLPGGTTITQGGITKADEQTLTTALTNLKDSSGNTVTSVVQTKVTANFADSKTTLAAPISLNGAAVSTVNTVNISAPTTVAAGSAVVSSVDVGGINTTSG